MLWDELSHFVQEPGKPQYHAAPGEGRHDDLTIGWLLALFTTYDEPMPPDMEPAAAARAVVDRFATDPSRMMTAVEAGVGVRPTGWLGDLDPWETPA